MIAIALLFLALLSVYAEDLNVFNGYLIPSSFTPACTSALQQNVTACNNATLLYPGYGDISSNVTLNNICTTSCSNALAQYHTNIAQQCAGASLNLTGLGEPMTYLVDIIWNSFNSTCLTDSATGEFCSQYIGSAVSQDANATSLPEAVLCSNCMVDLAEMYVLSPISTGNQAMQNWQYIQTTCGVVLNGTIPTPYVPDSNTTITPNATQCATGVYYSVKTDDTCLSISINQNVATAELIGYNNADLDWGCDNIATGMSLCLPSQCNVTTVSVNNTCQGIADAAGITLSQLVSWNDAVDYGCTNLQLNTTLCISQPGGAYIPPPVGNTTGVVGPPVYSYPPSTSTCTPPTSTSSGVGPTQSQTLPGCTIYYTAQSGDSCWSIEQKFCLAESLLYQWNPEIIQGNDCVIWLNYSYCVAGGPGAPVSNTTTTVLSTSTTPTSTSTPLPSPTAPGSIANCLGWHLVASGDGCASMESAAGITSAQFLAWNPEVNADCSNLWLGYYYCIKAPTTTISTTTTLTTPTSTTPPVPSPTGPGSISTCKTWYLVVSGDGCASIESAAGITSAQFLAWNPEVNAQCTNIWLGYYYCINA